MGCGDEFEDEKLWMKNCGRVVIGELSGWRIVGLMLVVGKLWGSMNVVKLLWVGELWGWRIRENCVVEWLWRRIVGYENCGVE